MSLFCDTVVVVVVCLFVLFVVVVSCFHGDAV